MYICKSLRRYALERSTGGFGEVDQASAILATVCTAKCKFTIGVSSIGAGLRLEINSQSLDSLINEMISGFGMIVNGDAYNRALRFEVVQECGYS